MCGVANGWQTQTKQRHQGPHAHLLAPLADRTFAGGQLGARRPQKAGALQQLDQHVIDGVIGEQIHGHDQQNHETQGQLPLALGLEPKRFQYRRNPFGRQRVTQGGQAGFR